MRNFFLLVLTALALNVCAQSDFKKADVLMFGISTDFNDSVYYMTPVQELDGALLNKKDFLLFREQYADTFESYVEERFGGTQVCAIFFAKADKKHRKMNKLYKKVFHLHEKAGGKLKVLKDFKFPLFVPSEGKKEVTSAP